MDTAKERSEAASLMGRARHPNKGFGTTQRKPLEEIACTCRPERAKGEELHPTYCLYGRAQRRRKKS